MTDRNRYFYNLGYREGELDTLFKNESTTPEERATAAWIKMRFWTHKRMFVKGYLDAVKNN